MAIKLAKQTQAAPEIIDALEAARDALQKGSISLVDKRNIAIHGVEMGSAGKISFLETHRGKGAFQAHEFGNEQLRVVGLDIIRIHETLSPVLKRAGIKWS